MSTLELKLSLIEQLTKIDDEQLLNKVLKKSIEESKQGLGMTTEELRKRHPLCK